MKLFGAKPKQNAEAVNAPSSFRPIQNQNHSPYQLCQPATGRTWWLKFGVTKLGRSLDNDIVLSDDSVSRHHAKICVDGNTLYIEDTSSVNGVFIAGEKVGGSILPTEVLFTIGRIDLVVRKSSLREVPVTDFRG